MYTQPTNDSVTATIQRLPEAGGFVMLNLFRLRETPDYSRFPQLKSETPLTSHELFYQYIAEMDQILGRFGIVRMFLADGAPVMIGPPDERWDVVQLVRYPSRQAFIDLSSDSDLRAHVPLREASVEDSRIMPMFEKSLDAVIS